MEIPNGRIKNLTGQTFRNKGCPDVTVLKYLGNNRHHKSMWRCRCACRPGVFNEFTAIGSGLLNGNTKSCGCYKIKRLTVHGGSGTPAYNSWKGMIDRCRNPNNPDYPRYGAIGTKVSKCWADETTGYLTFFKDMGPRPKGTSIDRYPNKFGNYEKGNCRWGTDEEQQTNKSNNVNISIKGITKTVSQWAREFEIHEDTIRRRLKLGWDPVMAVTEPLRHKGRPRTRKGWNG